MWRTRTQSNPMFGSVGFCSFSSELGAVDPSVRMNAGSWERHKF